MGTAATGTPLPQGPEAMMEADPVSLLRAAEIITGAKRPLVLAGNGVVRQEAAPALRAFCNQPASRDHHLHGQGRARRVRPALPVHRRAAAARTTRRACWDGPISWWPSATT